MKLAITAANKIVIDKTKLFPLLVVVSITIVLVDGGFVLPGETVVEIVLDEVGGEGDAVELDAVELDGGCSVVDGCRNSTT